MVKKNSSKVQFIEIVHTEKILELREQYFLKVFVKSKEEWMNGWMDVKNVVRIFCSNQQN